VAVASHPFLQKCLTPDIKILLIAVIIIYNGRFLRPG